MTCPNEIKYKYLCHNFVALVFISFFLLVTRQNNNNNSSNNNNNNNNNNSIKLKPKE